VGRPEVFEAQRANSARPRKCAAQIDLLQKDGTEVSRGGMNAGQDYSMDALSLFGLLAVTAMLVAYALEDRSHWFILAFAGACALGSAYGFLQGAWPFGLVEAIWAGVALRRWYVRRQ
jgi:hypothetical protein